MITDMIQMMVSGRMIQVIMPNGRGRVSMGLEDGDSQAISNAYSKWILAYIFAGFHSFFF
jgi:hypothetical protein